jgi:hypothetical protein
LSVIECDDAKPATKADAPRVRKLMK